MSRTLVKAGDALERFGRRLRTRGARASIKRRVTVADLERDGWASVAPTFVLSTGRAGTRLLTELLDASDGVHAHHAPRPELIRASRRAFELDGQHPEIFDEVLKTAREELIVADARRGQTFVETNNRVTFFAPAARRMFPNARFLHVVRHPADIVRSGIRRNWYSGAHDHDLGRIRPTASDVPDWDDRDPIWKIGWMWNTTCAFVEAALDGLPEARVMQLRAEDLFADTAAAIAAIEFCGGTPPGTAQVAARLQIPVNAQSTGSFPKLEDWTAEQRALLRDAAPLAERYGYTI